MKIPNDFTLYNTNKIYKPKFNLGDMVMYITDEDERSYLLYAYLINVNGDIRYCITRNGDSTTVLDFEIKLKDQ